MRDAIRRSECEFIVIDVCRRTQFLDGRLALRLAVRCWLAEEMDGGGGMEFSTRLAMPPVGAAE